MRILALEPYYGGSHRAFLDGWSRHSRHEWCVLGLPAYKWKWRMRHAAITLADRVRRLLDESGPWDALFASDMLNLAEFLGLAPPPVRELPAVAYFHENQLTYPVPQPRERDLHFGFTNLTTALAADAVWFNSAFHRDSFLEAAADLSRRMPDFQPLEAVREVGRKAEVWPQGVEPFPPRPPRRPGPLRILWSARWEHDKCPEVFFDAVQRLAAAGVDFRLYVLGQSFGEQPSVFAEARQRLAGRIERWGYVEDPDEYRRLLLDADVAVSAADHEFFGVALVEAAAAGAQPLVPGRLAYPEVFRQEDDAVRRERLFYPGDVGSLVARLLEADAQLRQGSVWRGDPELGQRLVEPFTWPRLAPRLDTALGRLRDASPGVSPDTFPREARP